MDNKQLSSLTNVWFAFDINYFKEYWKNGKYPIPP